MTTIDLFKNAFKETSSVIQSVKEEEGYVQCYYTIGDKEHFLRIGPYRRIINGYIAEDGKSYASGVDMNVLRYLLDNYNGL
jgi:hypothetical protein